MPYIIPPDVMDAGCKLNAGDNANHNQRPTFSPPDGSKWRQSFPPHLPENYSKTGDDTNRITVTQTWDDFNIHIQHDFIEKLIKAIKGAIDLATSLAIPGGNLEGAISNFVATLRDLLGADGKFIDYSWSFTFTVDPSSAHSLVIFNSHDVLATISTGSRKPYKWKVTSITKLDQQKLADLDINVSGRDSQSFTEERAWPITTSGAKHTITNNLHISLDSDSFEGHFKNLFDEFTKLIADLSNLDDVVDKVVQAWIDTHNTFNKPNDDQKRKKREEELAKRKKELADQAKNAFATTLKLLKDLLENWTGEIRLKSTSYVISCIKDDGLKFVEDFLRQCNEENAKKWVEQSEKQRAEHLKGLKKTISSMKGEMRHIRRANFELGNILLPKGPSGLTRISKQQIAANEEWVVRQALILDTLISRADELLTTMPDKPSRQVIDEREAIDVLAQEIEKQIAEKEKNKSKDVHRTNDSDS